MGGTLTPVAANHAPQRHGMARAHQAGMLAAETAYRVGRAPTAAEVILALRGVQGLEVVGLQNGGVAPTVVPTLVLTGHAHRLPVSSANTSSTPHLAKVGGGQVGEVGDGQSVNHPPPLP